MDADDWARAIRADTETVLRRLCADVDGALAEAVLAQPDAAERGWPAPVAGLREFLMAAVGAADFTRERTEAILATLSRTAESAGDGSVLTVRGIWTLDRMRQLLESSAPSAVAALPSSTPARPVYPRAKLPRLEPARNVDEVIARLDEIIDWAVEFDSGLGYFPTVYRRASLAIRDKIRAGDYFDDNTRMAQFDVVFAQRYFDALNDYFHPRDYQAPSHVWQWCFDGHESAEPIMLQHMLTAVNSHVNLDLGVAAVTVADGDLASLEADFDRINTLLADEVSIFLGTLEQLSPRIAVLRRILPCEDRALNLLLRMFRNLAWSFANQLDAHPVRRQAHIGVQDAWAGVLGSYYLHTSDTINRLVEWIAEAESRDVAHNVRVLAGQSPAAYARTTM